MQSACANLKSEWACVPHKIGYTLLAFVCWGNSVHSISQLPAASVPAVLSCNWHGHRDPFAGCQRPKHGRNNGPWQGANEPRCLPFCPQDDWHFRHRPLGDNAFRAPSAYKCKQCKQIMLHTQALTLQTSTHQAALCTAALHSFAFYELQEGRSGPIRLAGPTRQTQIKTH